MFWSSCLRPGKHFWDVTDRGTASLSTSGVPPPYLDSLLVQQAPVWLSPIWFKHPLETLCLPGTRDLHPCASCSNAAGHSIWQAAEVPPRGIGISTVMTLSSHQLPFTQHTPKAKPFYPSISFQVAPTFTAAAKHNSQRVSQSRDNHLALLSYKFHYGSSWRCWDSSPGLHLPAVLTEKEACTVPWTIGTYWRDAHILHPSLWLTLGQETCQENSAATRGRLWNQLQVFLVCCEVPLWISPDLCTPDQL